MNGIPPVPTLILTFAAWCLATGFSQDGDLPVLRRSFSDVAGPGAPFENDYFDPRRGETISFLGGADAYFLNRFFFLETAFHLSWPDRELHLRNLAWPGDTIFYQARPQFFYTKKGDPQPGSIPDHRERTEPGIIFLCFGKMESLDGSFGLSGFFAAYENLLDELTSLTSRFVLVSPTPFFPSGPAAAEAETRNRTLAGMAAGIRDIAEKRGLLFVDLFTPLAASPDQVLSSNGIHLSEAGHRAVAEQITTQLKFPFPARLPDSPSLQQSIELKNRLWQQYYRPSNWAFLFGDRQHVPASRDPVEREERWFVREIDSLPGLIAETEADIHRYAREAVKQ